MDGMTFELPLFLFATFAGAFIAGLSGFAFGLVAASLWLYILTPSQSATLIVAFGLLVQGYSVWKLRGALNWRKLWPFIAGAALGAIWGVLLLIALLTILRYYAVVSWRGQETAQQGVSHEIQLSQVAPVLQIVAAPLWQVMVPWFPAQVSPHL